tara:strand:+ start:1144 stop:1545 length:402 start_codon:yes stop_codon:yes gene_type:complete
MKQVNRPITNLEEFEIALSKASLLDSDRELIEYIRFIGVFSQPMLKQALRLPSKPPILSKLCVICKQIGELMPTHFSMVRRWSQDMNSENIIWDANLICCGIYNYEGEQLSPEEGNTQFHVFTVHKELFNGLD